MHILLFYISTFIRKQVPVYCINSFQFPIQQNCLHLLCSRPSTNSFFIFEKHSAFSTVGTVQKLLRFLYSRYYLETFQDQTLFSNNFENKLKVRVEGFSEILCSDFPCHLFLTHCIIPAPLSSSLSLNQYSLYFLSIIQLPSYVFHFIYFYDVDYYIYLFLEKGHGLKEI